jgi:hypothetical protein
MQFVSSRICQDDAILKDYPRTVPCLRCGLALDRFSYRFQVGFMGIWIESSRPRFIPYLADYLAEWLTSCATGYDAGNKRIVSRNGGLRCLLGQGE